MKRLTIALSICVGLIAPDLATVRGAAPAADETQPFAKQLQEKPDDVPLFNKYMVENLGTARKLIGSDLDQAETFLNGMQSVLESLEPQTGPGRQILVRGKAAVASYFRQVELGRITLDELIAKLNENPDDRKSISFYSSKLAEQISSLARSQPEQAETLLKGGREFLATVRQASQEEETKRALASAERSLARFEQSIESGKKLAALIGSEAAPLEVDAWVNGTALSNEDLQGKVVLLDFWAVWCGPCIQTFPHLREWQEKYAERGLMMIGLTRYYNYRWDEAAGRAKRAPRGETVSPQDEQQMLAQFAEEHDLHHRFAIQSDRTLSERYAVTGIPHVVVIDRKGIVRLVRVGSSPQNAVEISELLEKLIAEG